MIIIGMDDTDIKDSRGTNQLAKQIVNELPDEFQCLRILRHQLLDDPRVPYTSKNGSASITFKWKDEEHLLPEEPARFLLEHFRRRMKQEFIEGSDPGLSFLNGDCPEEVIQWGIRCKNLLVDKEEARKLASRTGIPLESLGGTEDGIIGALAALGLASTKNDGRIVRMGHWPDDLSDDQPVSILSERDVEVREYQTDQEILTGLVDVGKHLRPNFRNGRTVLFVEPVESASDRTSGNTITETKTAYKALKLT